MSAGIWGFYDFPRSRLPTCPALKEALFYLEKMNKDYFKWLRELQQDSLFIRYGGGDFRFHRKHFLAGWSPSDSAFMCVPF